MAYSRWIPWRSAPLGCAVAGAAAIAGVPLFLRMPPWCDLTLYDVAARNILSGGVHYRDVFDTNMPGFVWLLALVRWLFGWSVEAVRAVDLAIVAGIVLVLDRLVAASGASWASRAWAVAGVAIFYLFQSEFNHAQRDVWMLLPATLAVSLRFRRLSRTERDGSFRTTVLEGVLWGLAVWIKPHVVVPAAFVWLLTAARTQVWRDLLGQLLGGLVVGSAGVAYLILSGTWEHFLDVFTVWNTGYFETMLSELPYRFHRQLHYFPPFSYLQIASLSVAILTVIHGRPWCRDSLGLGLTGRWLPTWLWDGGSDDRVRLGRLTIAALYLGWTAQAFFLQRDFHYVHVPETILLLFVLATQRWAAGAMLTLWLTLTSAAVLLGVASPANVTGVGPGGGPEWAVLHPALDPDRMSHWSDCWRTDLSPVEYRRRRNAVALVREFHGATDWEGLGEVADWLRERGLRDGEVVGWHDSPHAAYLELGIRPGFRFQHVSHIAMLGQWQADAVNAEFDAAAPNVKYVISDLLKAADDEPSPLDWTATGPDLLPPGLSADARKNFPNREPAVFRSGRGRGRYIVHELRHPFTRLRPGS